MANPCPGFLYAGVSLVTACYALKALKQTLMCGRKQCGTVIRLDHGNDLPALILSHLLFYQRFRRLRLANPKGFEIQASLN